MFRKVRVREDAGGVKCLLRSPQVADQASWAIHLNLTKYFIFSGKIYWEVQPVAQLVGWTAVQIVECLAKHHYLLHLGSLRMVHGQLRAKLHSKEMMMIITTEWAFDLDVLHCDHVLVLGCEWLIWWWCCKICHFCFILSLLFLQLHQKMQWLKCNSPWGSSLVKTLSHISQNWHKIAREKKHIFVEPHLNSRARVRMVIFCKCCVLVSLPVILVILCLSGQKRKEKSITCTLQYPWWRQISVKNLAARWGTVQLFLFSYFSTEAYRWWINSLIFWNLFFLNSFFEIYICTGVDRVSASRAGRRSVPLTNKKPRQSLKLWQLSRHRGRGDDIAKWSKTGFLVFIQPEASNG